MRLPGLSPDQAGACWHAFHQELPEVAEGNMHLSGVIRAAEQQVQRWGRTSNAN